MGEGDSKSEVSEMVTNGTKSPEKEVVKVADKKENGVKEMEEDKKEDNGGKSEDRIVAEGEGEEKTDELKELKEDKEDKEEVNENKEEKEEPKLEAMEVENEKDDEMAEKADGSDEKKEDHKENGCDQVNDKEDAKEQEGGEEKEEGEEDKKDVVKESENEKEETVEAKEDAMESKEEKSSKKRSRGKSADDKEVETKRKVVELEIRTPTSDRPVRERKSVERLVAIFEKDNSREFHIEKGHGTPLKDIPNVAYKLSRKKSDDTFKLLHMILYGRRGKANQIKHNISRFSGFVWHDNEEKQRLKIKEKLDKCVKEKLLEFCDVLDISITKTTSRKEDIVVKLLDFLVAPHATTTELIAEKDQGKKRKRSATKGASASRKGSSKSQKKTGDASIKDGKKATSESDDESQDDKDDEEGEKENGVAESSEDEKSEQSDSEENKDVSENESEEDAPQEKASAGKAKIKTKRNSPAVESSGKAASRTVVTPRKARSVSKGTPKKSSVNSFKVVESADKSPKVFSRKKKEEEPKKEMSSASKKSATKEKSSTMETPAIKEKSASKDKSGKKAVKGKEKTKEDKLKPSDDELRIAICDILKEVDFNTATFTDILKQLAKQFKSDLAPRKSSIKLMIQDELTKLADEADDEEEDDEGDAEKNDAKPASKEVEV